MFSTCAVVETWYWTGTKSHKQILGVGVIEAITQITLTSKL